MISSDHFETAPFLSAVFPGLSGGEFRRAGITGEKGSEAIFLLIQKTSENFFGSITKSV